LRGHAAGPYSLRVKRRPLELHSGIDFEPIDLNELRPPPRDIERVVDAEDDRLYPVPHPSGSGEPARQRGNSRRTPPGPTGKQEGKKAQRRKRVPPAAGRANAVAGRRLLPRDEEERQAAKYFSLYNKRYKLVEHIGEGGMGVVYRARDTLLDIDVAVKILTRHALSDNRATNRFKAEAVTVMKLSHENIVQLHNVEVLGQRWFLVMEYVDGGTLADVLKQKPRLTPDSVVSLSFYASRALTYAHRQGVLHRDLKPANVMLAREGVLKIVDFGTALWTSQPTDSGSEPYIEGTPCYMSPEQIRADPLDVRTDVYSLGLTLYECLAGHPAFPHDSTPECVLQEEPQPITGVGEAVIDVISKATHKDPEARWGTVREFYGALAKSVQPKASAG